MRAAFFTEEGEHLMSRLHEDSVLESCLRHQLGRDIQMAALRGDASSLVELCNGRRIWQGRALIDIRQVETTIHSYWPGTEAECLSVCSQISGRGKARKQIRKSKLRRRV